MPEVGYLSHGVENSEPDGTSLFMLRRLIEPLFRGRISFETRVRGFVLALIALSALSANVGELKKISELELQPADDDVSRHEKRVAPLKNVLPQRGVVGFVTDAAGRMEEAQRRYMTGYALAPVVVAPGTGWPLVIGDFKDPAAATLMIGGALQVREDFGDGLVLFAKEER
jgi:hypothetical protein